MATAEVTTEPSEKLDRYVSVRAECSDCDFKTWTGGSPDIDWSHVIDRHLAQHGPGRAVDIEVSWDPSAFCPVCEDKIGDVQQIDDGLTCDMCGTTWDIEGKNGEVTDA